MYSRRYRHAVVIIFRLCRRIRTIKMDLKGFNCIHFTRVARAAMRTNVVDGRADRINWNNRFPNGELNAGRIKERVRANACAKGHRSAAQQPRRIYTILSSHFSQTRFYYSLSARRPFDRCRPAEIHEIQQIIPANNIEYGVKVNAVYWIKIALVRGITIYIYLTWKKSRYILTVKCFHHFTILSNLLISSWVLNLYYANRQFVRTIC